MDKYKKLRLFRGTIAVSAAYAILSFGIILTIYFTERGGVFVEETNFPFAISFCIGMLVIIGFLIYKVNTFEETPVRTSQYDNTTCPDFWKLIKTVDSDFELLTAGDLTDINLDKDQLASLKLITKALLLAKLPNGSENALSVSQLSTLNDMGISDDNRLLTADEINSLGLHLDKGQQAALGITPKLIKENKVDVNLRDNQLTILNSIVAEKERLNKLANKEHICVRTNSAPNTTNTTINTEGNNVTNNILQLARFEKGLESTSPISGSVDVKCNHLYPIEMAAKDVKWNPDNQNDLRCAYASTCGLSWSSVCQN